MKSFFKREKVFLLYPEVQSCRIKMQTFPITYFPGIPRKMPQNLQLFSNRRGIHAQAAILNEKLFPGKVLSAPRRCI